MPIGSYALRYPDKMPRQEVDTAISLTIQHFAVGGGGIKTDGKTRHNYFEQMFRERNRKIMTTDLLKEKSKFKKR